MRAAPMLLLALVLAASMSAGCIENMDRLKEILGAKEPPEPEPEPTYEPPLARAQANATDVLVGAPIRFTSDGSRDPQSLALTFTWAFGDGRSADGPVVVHAYDEPGEYVVRLDVANSQGLTDEATLTIQVRAPNAAPVARLVVRDADGRATTTTEAGDALTFDASTSTDADGDALTFDWDFGDGATSHDEEATHAFEKPGLYTVKLTVSDPAGLKARASRLIAVNATFELPGAFEVGGRERRAHTFPMAEGAMRLTATLTFDGAVGANDLEFVIKDAAGEVVAESSGETEAGAQGTQTRTVAPLSSDALRSFEAGAWTVEVVKQKGVQVAYELVVRETF